MSDYLYTKNDIMYNVFNLLYKAYHQTVFNELTRVHAHIVL